MPIAGQGTAAVEESAAYVEALQKYFDANGIEREVNVGFPVDSPRSSTRTMGHGRGPLCQELRTRSGCLHDPGQRSDRDRPATNGQEHQKSIGSRLGGNSASGNFSAGLRHGSCSGRQGESSSRGRRSSGRRKSCCDAESVPEDVPERSLRLMGTENSIGDDMTTLAEVLKKDVTPTLAPSGYRKVGNTYRLTAVKRRPGVDQLYRSVWKCWRRRHILHHVAVVPRTQIDLNNSIFQRSTQPTTAAGICPTASGHQQCQYDNNSQFDDQNGSSAMLMGRTGGKIAPRSCLGMYTPSSLPARPPDISGLPPPTG